MVVVVVSEVVIDVVVGVDIGVVVGFFESSFLLRSSRLLRSAFADVSRCNEREQTNVFQRETITQTI